MNQFFEQHQVKIAMIGMITIIVLADSIVNFLVPYPI